MLLSRLTSLRWPALHRRRPQRRHAIWNHFPLRGEPLESRRLLAIGVNDVQVLEGDSGFTAVEFTVTRSDAGRGTVLVDFTTADGTATVADNDYLPVSGTLLFEAGEETATITVQVQGDEAIEPDESFSLLLTASEGDTIQGGAGIATVLNDDEEPLCTEEDFIRQAYRDLLERQPEPEAVSFWCERIEETDRDDVVCEITDSCEYLGLVIDRIYRGFLDRPADPQARTSGVDFLKRGGTVDECVAFVLGSEEYYEKQGGSDQAFLQGLFDDALGRPIDPQARQSFGEVAGFEGFRTLIGRIVLASSESQGRLVDRFYMRFLGRPADAAGRAHFVSQLQQQASEQDLIVAILSSDEYVQRLDDA